MPYLEEKIQSRKDQWKKLIFLEHQSGNRLEIYYTCHLIESSYQPHPPIMISELMFGNCSRHTSTAYFFKGRGERGDGIQTYIWSSLGLPGYAVSKSMRCANLRMYDEVCLEMSTCCSQRLPCSWTWFIASLIGGRLQWGITVRKDDIHLGLGWVIFERVWESGACSGLDAIWSQSN